MKTHIVYRHNRKFINKNIIKFLFPLFFFLLADSILAYSFPLIVEKELDSFALLGLVMGASSVAGVIMDLIIPKFFNSLSWQKLLGTSIFLSFIFPIMIFMTNKYEPLLFLIAGSVIWGIYFEFLAFSQQTYIVDEEPKEHYSRGWGLIYVIWQITTLIGPFIGSLLLANGVEHISSGALGVQAFAFLAFYLFAVIFNKRHKIKVSKIESSSKNTLSFLSQIKLFELLSGKMISIFLIGFTASSLIALNWTFGGLFGEYITGSEKTGWIFIALFNFAILLSSLFLSYFPVTKRKKFLSQFLLLGAGITLFPLLFITEQVYILFAIFISGALLALALPLNDAVFSELAGRNEYAEKYVMSLFRIMVSLSYIVTPILSGMLAEKLSYGDIYGIFGLLAIVIGIISLIITPRKIRLPQTKISELFENE